MVCPLLPENFEEKKGWESEMLLRSGRMSSAALKSQFRCGVYTATHECVVPPCQGLPLGSRRGFRCASLALGCPRVPAEST